LAATTERAELEGKLAFVIVTTANAPADATLKVGGRAVPPQQASGPILVSPGAVDVILVDAGGKELARQTVSAAAGSKTPVTLDARPAPKLAAPGESLNTGDDDKVDEPPPAAAAPPEAPPESGSKGNLRTYAYVAAGVGVAGLATFGLFGLMSNSTYSDLQNQCHPGCPPSKQGEVDSGRTQQTVANIGLVFAVLGAAGAATLFILSAPSKSPAPQSALVIGPSFVGVRGTL
jgi:hypothetical protein